MFGLLEAGTVCTTACLYPYTHTSPTTKQLPSQHVTTPPPTSTPPFSLHCQDTVPKTQNKYSQKWNCPRYMNVEIKNEPRSFISEDT
jgi:hypothetical protein